MEWEEVVQIICDSVREQDTRRLVNTRLLESLYVDSEDIESAIGIDSVFDDVAESYLEDDEDWNDEDNAYDDE